MVSRALLIPCALSFGDSRLEQHVSLLVTIMHQLHLLQVFMAWYVLGDLEPVIKLKIFFCSYGGPKTHIEQDSVNRQYL